MRAYERLIAYTAYPTASDEQNPACPSSPAQMEFAHALVREMQQMGIADANVDANGYVFGTIPANLPDWQGDVIGFIAHMDVVSEVPYTNIQTRVLENYDGGDIVLHPQQHIVLSPKEFPSLRAQVGKTLLLTDGTTLLGADDKAGIAEILTMAERLLQGDIPHGTVKIGFTPDEEIGRGADLFDVARFGAKYAYTADGGAFGEVEYETFNAASADVHLHGVSIHPGGAKGKMRNAMLLAMEFDALLPQTEKPQYTEGYQGFYHLTAMQGQVEHAQLRYILRDHDATLLARRKQTVLDAAAILNEKYGAGTAVADLQDNYRNMAEQIRPHWHLIDNAYAAVKAAGGEPHSVPVRGGTDGSRLSFMGLPCPNLGTGSYNGHGRMEYVCVEEMDAAVEALLGIVRSYT